jgi:hypothetical protein
VILLAPYQQLVRQVVHEHPFKQGWTNRMERRKRTNWIAMTCTDDEIHESASERCNIESEIEYHISYECCHKRSPRAH